MSQLATATAVVGVDVVVVVEGNEIAVVVVGTTTALSVDILCVLHFHTIDTHRVVVVVASEIEASDFRRVGESEEPQRCPMKPWRCCHRNLQRSCCC